MGSTPPSLAVGAFRIALLTDGFWRNDGGCMFGVVPRELWKREHPPDDQNRIRLNLTCPLIIRGADAVLVDCGIGNRLDSVERKIFDHDNGWLPDQLAALGLDCADVTHVVVSHLHFDHSGGLVRRRNSGALESAFPRARILIRRGELDTARNPRNERLRAAYRHAAAVLAPVERQIEPLDSDLDVVAGVRALHTGGHTHDHQVVIVRDGDAAFVHLADIVPTRSHMKGPWNQAYDLDALRTMDQKARLLAAAEAGRWWVSFAHDDRVFTARVFNDRGRYALADVVAVQP